MARRKPRHPPNLRRARRLVIPLNTVAKVVMEVADVRSIISAHVTNATSTRAMNAAGHNRLRHHLEVRIRGAVLHVPRSHNNNSNRLPDPRVVNRWPERKVVSHSRHTTVMDAAVDAVDVVDALRTVASRVAKKPPAADAMTATTGSREGSSNLPTTAARRIRCRRKTSAIA